METPKQPSRRDVRVFGLLCLVLLPAFGWLVPGLGSSLPTIAAITGACWLLALALDRERSVREKAAGLAVPALMLALGGTLRLGAAQGLDEGLLRLWHAVGLGAVGVVLCVLAFAATDLGARIRGAWMAAALPIGWTVSHALLAVVFFGTVTPIGLVLRAFGRDALRRSFDPDATTYWMPREQTKDKTRYFKQF